MEFHNQEPTSADVKFMMERFSPYRDQILESYQTNDEFKSLCEDFYSSALILENLKQKLLKHKLSEFEYRRLFLDLENEILDFLSPEDDTWRSGRSV